LYPRDRNPSHPEIELADTAEDLRPASDGLARDLDVLSAIEAQKRTLEPGDPRLVELSERVEAVASRVLDGSSPAGLEDAPVASIDETPRPIPDILAEWRAAERRLEAAEPGSADALEAQALSDHLRQEYRQAYEAHGR
jgi:hypothetical protein